jgi:hypothetical protein
VKKLRSTHVSPKAPAPATEPPAAAVPDNYPGPAAPAGKGFVAGWVRFWFTPADPVGLHATRLLAGLLFLFWLLTLAGHEGAFFGMRGWLDHEAIVEARGLEAEVARQREEARQNNVPSLIPNALPVPVPRWSLLYFTASDPTLVHGIYWAAVAVVALFTLGVATRLTGVLTWVVVASFTANPAAAYDGDALLLLLAFYLMLGYLGYGLLRRGQSALDLVLGPRDALLLGGRPGPEGPRPSVAANAALRLLQVNFALLVVVSGLHKLQFGDWWSGSALWYALYPPLQTTIAQAREHAGHAWAYLGVLSLIVYAMLAWQLTFPAFAWRPRWRVLLLGGAALGWLGTALVFDLPLFGAPYFLGCLTYLTAHEWRRVLAWLPRVPGLQGLERRFPAAQAEGKRRAVSVAAGRER